MAQKKYVSLIRLSNFLDNIKTHYSQIGHKHTISDLTDYKIDSVLDSNSTNPVQNKVLENEFEEISQAMLALDSAIDGKADSSHTHTVANVTGLQSALDGKASKTEFDSHNADTTKHITSTERTNWNDAKTHADSAHAPSDAQPNQNAFSNVKVGSTTVSADSPTDTLTLVGSNVTITPDATNDKITFTVANGSTSAKGVVQLTDSTSSTSTTTAATPNSVKIAYDLASTAQTTADSKVPTTCTINGKALSSDIILSASDVGADASGSANTALTSAKSYTDTKINDLVNGAPTTLDTIKEVADAIEAHKEVTDALDAAIGTKANASDLTSHTGNKSNPHGVTKSQVGLGNVPNVATNDQAPTYSDTTTFATLSSGEKLSVAFPKIKLAITNLINHINNKSNPHVVTKSQVGLGNVDNTSDNDKPISTATQTALDEINSVKAPVANGQYAVTTAGTGSAYTATVPSITTLTVGASFIMIPHVVSTSTAPTLNVNGLGAKTIKRRLSSIATSLQSGYSNSWLAKDKPFRVVYDGTCWVVEGQTKPAAADMYGLTASITELNYCEGVASSIQTQLDSKAASSHNHSASDIISGVVPIENGGIGANLTNSLTQHPNAIIRGTTDFEQYPYLYYTATKDGAFYATGDDQPAKFGTLPIAQGGTDAKTASEARANLGALAKEGDTATGLMQLSGGFGRGTGTGMGMLITPKDGYLRTTHENNTGILKIVLPNDFNGAMIKFDVDIYSYNKQAICTYSFGGQIYKNPSTGANQWAYRSYSIKGNSANNDFMNLPINFGRHNEKAAVSIGIDTTEWRYCMFSIKNIEIMYNYYGVNNWDDGWSIIVDTNPLDEIFNTHDNPLNRNRQNLGFSYGTAVPTSAPATGEGSVYFMIDEDKIDLSLTTAEYEELMTLIDSI